MFSEAAQGAGMAAARRRITAAAALLGPAAGSQAHHAFSAEFDANLPIRVSGVVTRVEWINPHAWVHVRGASRIGCWRPVRPTRRCGAGWRAGC